MEEKTCSKCGFSYPENLFYRSNITGLTICANCLADIRRERELIIKHPKIDKPSILIAREKQKLKKKKSII